MENRAEILKSEINVLGGLDETKSEVLERYESKREQIYKELEIAFVQQRVRNKLLNKKSDCVEILFFNSSEEVEDLISESAIEDINESNDNINIDSENKDDESSNDFKNINSKEDINNGSFNEHTIKEDNIDNDSFNEHTINSKDIINEDLREIRPITNELKQNIKEKQHNSNLFNYLDLEAEYSGDDNSEESKDQDLSEIIDDSVDDKIDLKHFVNEKQENDQKMLENLSKKFIKKKKTEKTQDFEFLNFESNEDLPEIKDFESDESIYLHSDNINNETPTLTVLNMNRKIVMNQNDIFNNDIAVLEKLNIKDKDDKKTTGFTETTKNN